MKELLDIGIKDLCRADKIKKDEPTAVGIYFISVASLKFLYRDFEPRGKMGGKEMELTEGNVEENETPPLYFSINLLLCEEASQSVLL
jgi:hypothetical protein